MTHPIRLLAAFFLVVALPFAAASAQDPSPERLIAIWKSQGWKTDFTQTTIDLSEVGFGGPPRDGIPSIDDPEFAPIAADKELVDVEPVVSIELNGDARAYPLRYVTFHEIVNDDVGGVPVTVTYCPLCNTAIAFDRRIDGQVLEFGTTGLLRNSNLVMYDRTTDSWWQQFGGDAIAGHYAGQQLDLIPVRIESWALFKERFPKGKVLQEPTGFSRPYGTNPYVGYDSRAAPYRLFDGPLPDDIAPMARVVALKGDHSDLAVSLDHIVRDGPVEVDGFTFAYVAGQASALDTRDIAKGKDVGNVIVTRIADGQSVDVVHDVTFAFVYRAFEPEGRIVQK